MSTARAVGLLVGAAADAALGDPRRGHPVALFGRAAHALEQRIHRDHRAVGAGYAAVLVGGGVAAGAAAQRCTRRWPAAEAALTAAATWAVLGGASLAGEAAVMARLLTGEDVPGARQRLAHLCGRDAARLDEEGLARATVESLAENTGDAVVSPLLWGAVAGVPGLIGYRAVNTLDAMVGHVSPRYRNFGWAAARLDDAANALPARAGAALTAVCAPLVGGSVARALRTRHRDAAAHPSPNAGQLEASFAGALDVRLGGRTVYRNAPAGGPVAEGAAAGGAADGGVASGAATGGAATGGAAEAAGKSSGEAAERAEQRPVMGRGRTAGTGDVARAVRLSRAVGAASAALAAGVALAAGTLRRGR
ncbi:cobalamin biosynthesis protein [Bounagaea algeriensis]